MAAELRLQRPAAEDNRQKLLESLSKAGIENFTMKAAVPGTEVPGHKASCSTASCFSCDVDFWAGTQREIVLYSAYEKKQGVTPKHNEFNIVKSLTLICS